MGCFFGAIALIEAAAAVVAASTIAATVEYYATRYAPTVTNFLLQQIVSRWIVPALEGYTTDSCQVLPRRN
jgi:hypothetical protein